MGRVHPHTTGHAGGGHEPLLGGVAGLFLAGYLLVEAFGVSWLSTSPELTGGRRGHGVAVGLLVADSLLPVPSSLVMIALGGLYGAVLGGLLALAGRVGMAMIGFAVGRRGGPLLARLVPASARPRADGLLQRWGPSRSLRPGPVPLVAKTVAVMAGPSTTTWPRAALAALVGSLPEAATYSWAGAAAQGAAVTRAPPLLLPARPSPGLIALNPASVPADDGRTEVAYGGQCGPRRRSTSGRRLGSAGAAQS